MTAVAKAVLLADTDPEFRESLVNHLLLTGVETLMQVQDGGGVARLLPQFPFDLVIMDYDLYLHPAARAIVDHHHRMHQSGVILTLSDERSTSTLDVLKERAVYLCVPKTSARRILATLADP